MSRLAIVLLLASMQIALGQDRFPTCQELLDSFGSQNPPINLFTNAGGVRSIVSTECLQPDGLQVRLLRVYFCTDEVLFLPGDSVTGLSPAEIHDLDDVKEERGTTDDPICFGQRRVTIPIGDFPPGNIACPPSSVPTRRSQYAQDATGLCFAGCTFSVSFRSASFITQARVNPVTQCCAEFQLQQGIQSAFSFIQPRPATCIRVQ